MCPEKQVHGQIATEKGRDPVQGDRTAQKVQHDLSDAGGLPKDRDLPRRGQNRAPVQGHQEKSPEGRRHVERPRKSHAAPNGPKGKHVVGEKNTADHQPKHIDKYQQVDRELENPRGRVFPPKQALVPSSVRGSCAHRVSAAGLSLRAYTASSSPQASQSLG